MRWRASHQDAPDDRFVERCGELAFGLVAPNLPFLQLPKTVAADLRAREATTKGEVLMVGYKEPYLAFYQGGTIREAVVGDLYEIVPALTELLRSSR